MTRLILVRHGETDWNIQDRIQGGMDIPLNEQGRKQAEIIASELFNIKIDVIYSSTLSRAYETARIISKIKKLKIKKENLLNEIHQGVWQGLLVKQARQRYKKTYSIWESNPAKTKPPQGESIQDVYNRIVEAMERIVEKYRNKTICIVSHKVVIALIKVHFLNQNISDVWNNLPENGSWEILEV